MLQEVLPEGASFGIVHRWLSVHGLVLDCGQFDGAGEVRHPCKADGRSRDCRHTISHAPMTISEYVEFCFAPARDVDKGVRMFFWTVRRPVQGFCGTAPGSSSPVTS